MSMSDDTKPEELDVIGQPRYPYMDESGTVDLSQIECNLMLTPAERLRRHDEFRIFVEQARRANEKRQHDADAANSQATE
jgi:hypothetical protein